MARGMPNAASSSSSQSSVSRFINCVRLALVHVGEVQAAVRPAGQVPHQEGVDVAEQHVAALGGARAPGTLSRIQRILSALK